MNFLKKAAILALVAGFSGAFAAEDEILGTYGPITIKEIDVTQQINGKDSTIREKVAYIDDESDEIPVIAEDVLVDSVFYSRVFKQGVPSTLMLPFEMPTWKLAHGFAVFEYVRVMKYCETCPYQVEVRNSSYTQTIKANTPYVVISETGDVNFSFHTNRSAQEPEYAVLNTTTNDRKLSYSMSGIDWTFHGTYERIEFTNPAGYYGFAAKDKNDVKMGDFKKAACNDTSCAYVRPFRGYLKCTISSESQKARALAKSTDDIASLEDLPESIEVHIIEDDSNTTYLGRINTTTGEFIKEDNRWFDMKGRLLERKPTTSGTYYYNRKKVIVK